MSSLDDNTIDENPNLTKEDFDRVMTKIKNIDKVVFLGLPTGINADADPRCLVCNGTGFYGVAGAKCSCTRKIR